MSITLGKFAGVLRTERPSLLTGWVAAGATACLGVLVAVAQFHAGVRVDGPGAAHDGAFAIWSLIQFRGDLAATFVPRWSPAGFNGLGSPLFYFYSPGAFYAATVTGFLAPAMPPADVIALTEILFRILAIGTCFAWLRRRTSPVQALFGGGLYSLMPWVAVFDPEVRLAFAEMAAVAVLPLVFLAADLGKGRPARLFLGTALTTGLLTLIHLPTLVANSGVLLTYVALSDGNVRRAIRSSFSLIAGIGLGLASAGYMLLPALGLLSSITSSALWDEGHRPEGNYFLTVASLQFPLGILTDICLLAPVLLAAAAGARGLRSGRVPIGLVGSLAVACFFLLPISSLLWNNILPLRMVQFPGRFMPSVSLLASAIVAVSLGECRVGMQRSIMLATWAMGVCALVFALRYGDGASAGAKRTQDAIVQWRANAPEYIPAAAGSKGWFELMPDQGSFQEQRARLTSPCASEVIEEGGATGRQDTFDVSRCTGSVILPRFFFPGWTARSDDGQPLAVSADDKSGLVMIGLPSRAERITLGRTSTRIESAGLLISLVSVAILMAFAVKVWLTNAKGV